MQGVLRRLEAGTLSVLSWVEGSALRRALLIALVALATLLPGLADMPPTDRDESRFVQASRQMIETGDPIDIRFQDEPRWKKPAGIYWLQAASASAFGGAEAPIWAYRLPSALAVFAAGLLTIWSLLPILGARAATIAGVMLSSALIAVVEGHIAKTDATLLALTLLAQGALVRLLTAPPAARFGALHALFWVALGLGMLIKGPVILLAAGGMLAWVAIAERSLGPLRRIRLLPGLGILVLVTLPWVIAIWLRTGGAFFEEAIGEDLLGKVTAGAEKHWGPPGYYIATLWATFWPWMPLSIFAAPMVWRQRRDPAMRILLGWAMPFWLVFALVSTKLPHYILPVLPALAGLLAIWVTAPGKDLPGRLRGTIAGVLFALVGGLLALAAILGPLVIEGTVSPMGSLLGLLCLGAVVLGFTALAERRIAAFLGAGLIAALCLYPAVLRYTLPELGTAFLSPRLVEMRAGFDGCSDRPLVSVGYHEPSLVFAAGTDTRLATPDAAAALLSGEDGWLVFFEEARGRTLADFARTHDLSLSVLGEVEGFNYNRGKGTTIFLVAREGDPALAGCPAPQTD